MTAARPLFIIVNRHSAYPRRKEVAVMAKRAFILILAACLLSMAGCAAVSGPEVDIPGKWSDCCSSAAIRPVYSTG